MFQINFRVILYRTGTAHVCISFLIIFYFYFIAVDVVKSFVLFTLEL